MLNILLLITFCGLALTSQKRLGLANPFQIYFLVWFLVFLGYFLSGDSYIKLQADFLIFIVIINAFALLFALICTYNYAIESEFSCSNFKGKGSKKLIGIAQIVVLFGVPFTYEKALLLSNGVDIFTVLGYIQLRYSLTEEGQVFGFSGYLFTLSYVVSSLSIISYFNKEIGFLRLAMSICISLFYVYVGTGRTSVLLFLLLLFIPLILLGKFGARGIFIFFILLIALFLFVAGMTSKGVSVDSDFLENISSILENARAYTVAPFLAFSTFMSSEFQLGYGENVFRTFIAVAYNFGLTDIPPVALIKNYVYVPDLTNVYTVYEVYFRDFSYFGLFFPQFFLLLHWWLYKIAFRKKGVWIFYYAASSYPLVMQFFQDQYLSLLSTWVQIGVWYWFFLDDREPTLSKANIRHA